MQTMYTDNYGIINIASNYMYPAISVTSLANAGQVVKASVAGASSGSDTSITTTPVTRLVPQFAQLVTTPGGRQLVLSSQQVITSQGGGTTGKSS